MRYQKMGKMFALKNLFIPPRWLSLCGLTNITRAVESEHRDWATKMGSDIELARTLPAMCNKSFALIRLDKMFWIRSSCTPQRWKTGGGGGRRFFPDFSHSRIALTQSYRYNSHWGVRRTCDVVVVKWGRKILTSINSICSQFLGHSLHVFCSGLHTTDSSTFCVIMRP